MKKLTVMVSLYAGGDWIENRLDNLCKTITANDQEIWVVNANSPDIRDHDIPQKFPVQYIKLADRIGVYAAWNYIIKNSNSHYITNANADDLIAPNGYEKLINILDSKLDVDFTYPSWYTTGTPNLKWDQVVSSGLASADGLPGAYAGNLDIAGVGHFPMWRRSLHSKHGFFDERFNALGDADWWARCFYIGRCQFRWLNNFLACYLWRSGDNLWHRAVNEPEWDLYHRKISRYREGHIG